jgi:hypothetical protein
MDDAADVPENRGVPLEVAMRKIQPEEVHAALQQGLDHFR